MSDVVRLDPDDPRATICGTCGAAWDDTVSTSVTPTPAGRCPFEYDHEQEVPDAQAAYVMVLNDGETFTNLDGCMIVRVPPNYAQDIDDIESFLSYPSNYEMDAIVGYFEERDNDFRFVSYVPKR